MRWNHKRALEELNDFYCFFTGGRRFIRKLYATEDWGIGFIDEGDVCSVRRCEDDEAKIFALMPRQPFIGL